MKASYRTMLIEHEAIELAAQMLLDDLEAGHVSNTELSNRLGLLRGIIDHHLVAEERVFSQLSAKDLSEPPRVCRRPLVVRHAAISMLSAAA